MGGGGFIVESLFATLFSMWWQFCYVFLRMGRLFLQFKGLFSPFFHAEAFLLRLSPYGGLFSPFKSLSATFFSMSRPFCYVWGGGGGFFPPFEGLSATFFLHVGVLFLVLWGCPPIPKFWWGLKPACPLTPMSSMQFNHSLTASCHFRDILKIVKKYLLTYIFAWLTIFKIRKRNENNIF